MNHASTGGARRRGTVAVLTLVMIFVLLGFAGLAVDGGYLYNLHNDVQIAADAGALAGASALFTAPDAVQPRAFRFTSMNRAAQRPVAVMDGDIELGHWSALDQAFTPLVGAEADQANAVRVKGSQLRVPAFFAGLMGVTEFNVSRSAIGHKIPPCGGVWGTQAVEISGDATTDSYRSSSSGYLPGLAGENGDVCSNGPIEVIGSAEVHGDASPGPGMMVDLIGSGSVSGSSTPGCCTTEFPPVELGDVATNNDNASIGLTSQGRPAYRKNAGGAWDLYVSGGPDNLTLEAGTYYFTSMEIRSQATLTINGPVTIYVTGDVGMGGGAIVNASKDPHDLTIYSTGKAFELHGGSGFYGSLYAPNTDVSLIGSSSYYGQIVGKTVDVGGTADIHVDESLDLFMRAASAPMLVQ